MAITEPRDMLRLQIGDTDVANPLFDDDELDLLLTRRDMSVLAAAHDACEILATRFARDFDVAEDGQNFRRAQRAAQYRDMARELRRHTYQSGSARLPGVAQTLGLDDVALTDPPLT